MTGVLVKLVAEKGFGFLRRRDARGDIFLHCSALSNPDEIRELQLGDELEFDLAEDPRSGKPRAANARRLEPPAIETDNGF
jgi:cold shock CspA family protein